MGKQQDLTDFLRMAIICQSHKHVRTLFTHRKHYTMPRNNNNSNDDISAIEALLRHGQETAAYFQRLVSEWDEEGEEYEIDGDDDGDDYTEQDDDIPDYEDDSDALDDSTSWDEEGTDDEDDDDDDDLDELDLD